MAKRASLWILLLALCLPLIAAAQPRKPKIPPTLLLLASGLTFDDLRPGGPLPSVRALADSGGIALMNAAVTGQSTRAAAFLTIGGGERLAAPATPLPSPDETGRTPTAEEIAFDIRPNSPEARALYRRRFGAPPARTAALLHTGLPALRRVQPGAPRADRIGALGSALRDAGHKTAAYGAAAALVLADRDGLVARGSLNVPAPADLTRVLTEGDVVAISPADARTLDALAAAALPLVREGQARVIVAATPPLPESGERWTRLGFVVCAGAPVPARSLLYSPTTRTRALAASVDIAPTVLRLAGVQTPFSGAGRALEPIPSASPWGEMAESDRRAVSATRSFVPVMVAYVAVAILTGFLCLGFLVRRADATVPRIALHIVAAALIAFLPMSVLSPATPLGYGLLLAAISIGITALAWTMWRRYGISPLGAIFVGIVVVLALDALSGSPLESHALLSGYVLAGIRFYGIGNEYMGLMIGAALVGPLMLRKRECRPGASVALLLLWAIVLATIGVPGWGANAGGAIAGAVAFTVGFFALRGPLRRRHIAAAFAAAIVLALALALADRLRPVDQRTHMGMALAAPRREGYNPILDIAVRKIRMNASIVAAPGTLATLAAMIPLWWLLSRGPFGARVQRSLERRSLLRRIVPAVGWGAAAAFAFNDSGVVAAITLVAPLTGAVVDALLEDATAPAPAAEGSAE